ncbi:MAG: lycopene cyclase domain-containing protein [Corynebacterium sp.]|uniref:lycopene cyclase domain-containing protein n=1 Tax=Corynebacterium sp. TaxID=1720 RepID=UPI0026DB6D76|nr:lycopene cyclase domain-containing protein [Corynebacterium sp.]MDO5099597.1 lycopene cyclase domain-containing protein [Corynebacterium sp.]
MTYTLISIPFLLGAIVLWLIKRPKPLAVTGIVLAVLLVLTAIFDNLMIWAKLVGYGESQRLGIHIGLVPLEDFFYPIVAVLIITAVWRRS